MSWESEAKAREHLQVSRRTWLLIGAGFGFAVPIILNVFQRYGPWHVRPSAYFLFRPGLLVLAPVGYLLQKFVDFTDVLGLLVVVVNAAVFGAVAYGMREYFLILIAAVLAVNYFSLPPSDENLERQFADRESEFVLLIQKSNKTPSVVRISNDEILDSDGRKYIEGDRVLPISPESWKEYRELFKKTGMKEGLYRSPQTGSIQFLGHTIFGKLGPIGTLYGYVYCPAASDVLQTGFLPCSQRRAEYDIIDYRYKRIAPQWFIDKIFQTHSLIN